VHRRWKLVKMQNNLPKQGGRRWNGNVVLSDTAITRRSLLKLRSRVPRWRIHSGNNVTRKNMEKNEERKEVMPKHHATTMANRATEPEERRKGKKVGKIIPKWKNDEAPMWNEAI
jgi:hypothetical protein